MKQISRFFVLILTLIFLSGCQPANSEEPKAAVKPLLEKARANMVFVEGGSFMMGDAGSDPTRSRSTAITCRNTR